METDVSTTYPPNRRLMAARRDASWYSCPGRAGRYHVVAPDGIGGLCGVQMLAAVGETSTAIPAERVEPVLRCRRRGCAEAWPAPSGGDN